VGERRFMVWHRCIRRTYLLEVANDHEMLVFERSKTNSQDWREILEHNHNDVLDEPNMNVLLVLWRQTKNERLRRTRAWDLWSEQIVAE
jgi:hypothetical protein